MAEALVELERRIRAAMQESLRNQVDARLRVFADVLAEREAQDDQWGVQNHHPAYWLAILGKQVGQMGTAILNREWWTDRDEGNRLLRHEAVQMVAVGFAMLECIDRGEMPVGLITLPTGRQRAKALGHGDEQLDYGVDEPDPNDDEQRA